MTEQRPTITANTYWSLPEDIQADWATVYQSLIEWSNGKGGCLMTVYVLIKDGRLMDTLQPDYHQLEPKRTLAYVNSDGISWWAFVRRMISVAGNMNAKGGIVYASVILDSRSNPVMWGSPMTRPLKSN